MSSPLFQGNGKTTQSDRSVHVDENIVRHHTSAEAKGEGSSAVAFRAESGHGDTNAGTVSNSRIKHTTHATWLRSMAPGVVTDVLGTTHAASDYYSAYTQANRLIGNNGGQDASSAVKRERRASVVGRKNGDGATRTEDDLTSWLGYLRERPAPVFADKPPASEAIRVPVSIQVRVCLL